MKLGDPLELIRFLGKASLSLLGFHILGAIPTQFIRFLGKASLSAIPTQANVLPTAVGSIAVVGITRQWLG